MVDVAPWPQTWALEAELKRVQQEEASQRRLLEILQQELTGLCEQFCEDANDSARRLDEARMLLASAIASHTELETEVERQRDAFSQLHCCAVDLSAEHPELAAALLSDIQIGLGSKEVRQSLLDRDEYMEILRQESKWWSLEEVLTSFEERVNVLFEATGGSPEKDKSMLSQVPMVQTEKDGECRKISQAAGQSVLIQKGMVASAPAQQLTESAASRLHRRASPRRQLGRSTYYTELAPVCPSHTALPVAKRIPKSPNSTTTTEQKFVQEKSASSSGGSLGYNMQLCEELQRYLHRKPPAWACNSRSSNSRSTRRCSSNKECHCRLCCQGKPHHEEQRDCDKDEWEERKFWPRCVKEPFR